MLVFIFTFLLQTFCYGAQKQGERLAPEEEQSFQKIISVGRVNPFFYSYYEKFYHKFADVVPLFDNHPPLEGVNKWSRRLFLTTQHSDQCEALAPPPPPNPNLPLRVLKWSECYFLANGLKLPDQSCSDIVDDALREALKIADVNSFYKKKIAKRPKVAIVECYIGSLIELVSKHRHTHFYFFASERLLTEKDCRGEVEKEFLQSLHVSKVTTEYTAALMLSSLLKNRYGVTLSVVPTSHLSSDHTLQKSEKTIRAIQDVLQQRKNPHLFDAIFCTYPFCLEKQKMAKHILSNPIPFYSIDDPTASNHSVLQALHLALHVDCNAYVLDSLVAEKMAAKKRVVSTSTV